MERSHGRNSQEEIKLGVGAVVGMHAKAMEWWHGSVGTSGRGSGGKVASAPGVVVWMSGRVRGEEERCG